MNQYRLYGRQSSGSFAVQVALEEIGVPFERVWIADVYLYMLASWYPGGKEGLHARLPPLRQHAQALSLRPALSRVEADHAG